MLASLVIVLTIAAADAAGVGVNYGMRATNLPPPADVARFLAGDTIVGRVRLFDADPLALQAFASTGLAVDVTVPNAAVPRLADLRLAQEWVRRRVAPYAAATNISRILVGDEVTSQANRTLLLALVPAMQSLHAALVAASLHHRIKISTAHSLAVLAVSSPPSAGRFRDAAVKPLLSFLRATGAPFMVNAYPFYAVAGDDLDYALFRMNDGVVDDGTGLLYTNMLDAQLDAVHSAMTRLGFGDVDVVVAATGWPSAGEDWEAGAGADRARDYNKNAIRHLGSGVGTPLMPNRTFELSIASLFDENLRPGPASARSFGLFRADMKPAYDAGIVIAGPPVSAKVAPAPETGQWCVAKPAAEEVALQENIDFVCGQGGVDCGEIRAGGTCYEPDTVQAHASYAMNLYFQSNGRHDFDCDFGQTAVVTTVDPSYASCRYTTLPEGIEN